MRATDNEQQTTNIKILHLDSNHPLLIKQLQQLGFTNHEDFGSTKEEVEANHPLSGIRTLDGV